MDVADADAYAWEAADLRCAESAYACGKCACARARGKCACARGKCACARGKHIVNTLVKHLVNTPVKRLVNTPVKHLVNTLAPQDEFPIHPVFGIFILILAISKSQIPLPNIFQNPKSQIPPFPICSKSLRRLTLATALLFRPCQSSRALL